MKRFGQRVTPAIMDASGVWPCLFRPSGGRARGSGRGRGSPRAARVKDVLAREHAGALGAARGDRVADRAVLEVVAHVQLVDLEPARPTSGRRTSAERSSRGVPRTDVGRGVDHVVEAMVGAGPLDDESQSCSPARRCSRSSTVNFEKRFSATSRAARSSRVIRGVARAVANSRAPRAQGMPREALSREEAHADTSIRLERDESEGGQPAERLADRGAADCELLGKALLAENRARLDPAGHDRLLECESDIVGLRARRHRAIGPGRPSSARPPSLELLLLGRPERRASSSRRP